MIETKQLQYLVVCAQLRSFSKAAEALYTTQPNVSKVIRMLEDELGFPVFVRQSRGITLTARGQRVYEYASRAVENIEQLKSFSRMDRGKNCWHPGIPVPGWLPVLLLFIRSTGRRMSAIM